MGSAPNFPYGTMDDIVALSDIAMEYGVPLHVDACLGGFIAAFMHDAGRPVPVFDFRLPGVSSISADTHKVRKLMYRKKKKENEKKNCWFRVLSETARLILTGFFLADKLM